MFFFSILVLSLGYKANIDLSLKVIEGKNKILGIPEPLLLCRSNKVESPLICGLFIPRLVIPYQFFEQYTLQEQKLILQHEVCHFIRKDLYANLVALMILIVFWFNPLVWLAYFRFRKDQELACDCEVLVNTDKQTKLIYSRALLKCAQSNGQYNFAQLLYGDKKTMTERILQIKTMRPVSKLISALALTIGVLACVSISFAGNTHEDKKYNAKADVKTVGPHPIYRVEPKYPVQAAKDNVFGHVVLTFDVDSSGDVNNVNVVSSQPKGVFDQVSIAALSQWRYQASDDGMKNSRVQLDYELDVAEDIERIKVTQ